MTGCIFKRKLKSGLSWGYSFFAGRDENGKRIQVFKTGYPTKGAAEKACSVAIAEHETACGTVRRDLDLRGRRVWTFSLGGTQQSGFSNKSDAERALAEMRERLAAEQVEVSELMKSAEELTLQRFFEYWLKEHAGRRCAPKTLERYGELARYLYPHLGGIPIHAITTAQIQAAVHALEDHGGAKTKLHPVGRPLAPKTVRHVGTLLYTVLAEAERLGHRTTAHPMANKRVRLPKLAKRRPAVLDPQKLALLFKQVEGTRLFPLIVLGVESGCRRGELLALQWSDVHFDSGVISVSKSLEQTKAGLRVKSTKSGEAREVGISDWALEVLRQHREEQDGDRKLFGVDYLEHDLVFCQPGGAYYSPDRVGARVVEAMKNAGLQGVSLHSLRHSNASISISRGVPIAVVSERLGHADQNITLSIYSHALPADKRAATKIWSDAMAEAISSTKAARRKRMLADVSAKDRPKVVNG